MVKQEVKGIEAQISALRSLTPNCTPTIEPCLKRSSPNQKTPDGFGGFFAGRL